MLSDKTLERVSVAYRKGYRDGYCGREEFCAVKPEYIKPFADFDYSNGYKAGKNDAEWSKRKTSNDGHYHGVARFPIPINDPACPVCNADGHLGTISETLKQNEPLMVENSRPSLNQ